MMKGFYVLFAVILGVGFTVSLLGAMPAPVTHGDVVSGTANVRDLMDVSKSTGSAAKAIVAARSSHTVSPVTTILVDDFVPQPYQGEAEYYYNRIGGDRGALGNAALTLGQGQMTATLLSGPWGGVWTSFNHPNREKLPVNMSALLPPQILPPYQSQVTGLTLGVVRATPGALFKIELKDEQNGNVWRIVETTLDGNAQTLSYSFTSSMPVTDVTILNWFLDNAGAGDYVVVDAITLTATHNVTDVALAGFVWSYGMWLNNWDPASGLVRDKARYASGEFDAIQATGSLAAATAMAEQLGVVGREDAVEIVARISNTLLISVPRYHGLWPHWVELAPSGALTIVQNTEWSSVDTIIAALSLLQAQSALGLSTQGTEQVLQEIDWQNLRLPDGLSHGYNYTSALLTSTWDTFGGESWLVQLAYAAATGQVAPLPYPLPPTANGSGFIDELSWLFVPPPRVDFWGADWEAYRPAAADNQISYHCTAHPTSCLCELGLFGLSAAEVPAPSLVTATQIYTPFGVGGQHVTIANDSLWTIGVPVAVPHYAPLIASLHPTAAIRMWDWLIDDGPFSPLNNIESHMFPPDSSCDASALQWNQLKGSWNLALQTLGWGRYLAQRAGQEPILWQAMISNTLLKQGYDILATPAAVQIAGPTTGAIDTPYTFTATLSHDSTTSPITYSWHVTGQGRPVTHTGGLSDTITFTWPTVGPRVITVTVDNVGGIPVTDTHSIAVRVPPNGVQVRGPALGATDTVYTFTAEVIPITTTLPVTYVWRATGYNAPILNTGGLSSTVTYTWPMTGTPVVTVTAANGNGRVVTGTHVISIIVPSLSVHKAGPAAAAAGERITYTIQVTNHSILTLTATITDELPGGVDATDVMTTWSPVTIAPHAVWTEHVAVTVTGEFLGVLTNILRVTTLEGVGDMARTRTCVPGCRQYLPLIFSNW